MRYITKALTEKKKKKNEMGLKGKSETKIAQQSNFRNELI